MYMDPITETVAHFIGLFNTELEQARLREKFQEFDRSELPEEDEEDIKTVDTEIKAPHQLRSFEPDVVYNSQPLTIVKIAHQSDVDFPVYGSEIESLAPDEESAEISGFPGGQLIDPLLPLEVNMVDVDFMYPEFTPPDPPGSVVVLGQQQNIIYDDDWLVDSAFDGREFTPLNMRVELQPLVELAENTNPLPQLTHPEDEAAIGDLVEQIEAVAAEFKSLSGDSHPTFIATGDDAYGITVNQGNADEMPILSDHLPSPQETATGNEDAEMSGSESSDFTEASLDAGGNTLINQASIVNAWSLSPTVIVAGDSHYIDFISQVSVHQDIDSVQGFGTTSPDDPDATEVFNSASLSDPFSPPQSQQTDAPALDGLPFSWTVTRLDGNLVVLNWIEQYNFVSDSDIVMATRSGHDVMIGVGDNTAVNSMSLFEIGYGFDLVVFGGDFYSANVISQMNILLDNDLVVNAGSVAGEADADVSTSGNLLWNQASIDTTGSINFDALPSHFKALADDLSMGSDFVGSDVLGDDAFAGLQNLRVLYVEGDFLDLQYISQTNILGDSDQIAVLTEDLGDDPSSHWDIETGDNALINVASILDVIPDVNVHVGGEQYSDAILFQADLMPADDGGVTGEHELVSEAVLFLADGMLGSEQSTETALVTPTNETDVTSSDVMQTVLG